MGDSHAVAFTDSSYQRNLNLKYQRFDRARYLFVSLWFRDTLAYQVSQGKYSERTPRILRWLRYLRFTGVKFVFCFGEIDVRCHLADLDKDSNFLEKYVEECSQLVGGDPHNIAFVTPTPPSDFYEDHPDFPRNGTLSERIRAHNIFCQNLKSAAESQSFACIDTRVLLSDEHGGLKRDYTQDGCHLNTIGSSIVRFHILNSWI